MLTINLSNLGLFFSFFKHSHPLIFPSTDMKESSVASKQEEEMKENVFPNANANLQD